MNQTQKWSAGTVVLSLLIVVASWFLLLSPQRSDTAALKAQKTKQDQTNAATQSDVNLLRSMAVELPAQRAIIAKFHDRVPDNPALPSLVRTLTTEASKAGVVITTLAPSQPAPADANVAPGSAALQQISLNLIVTGDYFAVETFLGRLESLQRVFLVTGLQVSPSEGATTTAKSAPGRVSATISGRVFMTGTVAAAAGAAAPAAAPAASSKGTTTTTAGAAPTAAAK